MDGIKFIRFCQKFQRNTIRNFYKLKRFTKKTFTKKSFRGDILKTSRKLRVSPVMIVRHLLKLEGYSKREIQQIVREKQPAPRYLQKPLEIALKNDPVFSPKGIKYGKERGALGEELLAEWLDTFSIYYDRDLGQGGPDFLLSTRLNIDVKGTIKEFDWIESKASYGDKTEVRKNHKQFDRYDFFGYGMVFYWYGADPQKKYTIFTWKDLIKHVNPELQKKIRAFIAFVPPEFKHLLNKA